MEEEVVGHTLKVGVKVGEAEAEVEVLGLEL